MSQGQFLIEKHRFLYYRRVDTESCCIALSHARRFGKSQAAKMIDAYYSFGSDSRELFAPYKIAKEKILKLT